MDWKNILFTFIVALIFCGIFALSMHRDRSRYRNVIFLLFAAISLVDLILSFFGRFATAIVLVLFAVLSLFLLVFPFLLIFNGVVMTRREGKSLANLLSLLLGIVLLAGEVSMFLWGSVLFIQPIAWQGCLEKAISGASPALMLLMVTTFYLSFTFLIFAFYCFFLQLIPVKKDFDYVIIHGAGLRKDGTVTKLLAERCDKAIAIYRRDPTPPYLIPSGGQGGDEVCSEADAMRRYLIEKGIPEDKILMEDKSTTTLENIRNSRDLIESRPGRKYTALVTSNYHVYRAMRYARKAGLNAVGIGAHVASYYWPSAIIREFVAVHREKKHLLLYVIGYLIVISPLLLVWTIG
ncbi:MAG: YdcF family protein [Lachnospiraceae bacterium]|nr:YdcF family protein [Lachnospiraceae bacterium]